MFDVSKEIFEFPLETKLKNVSNKPFYGYLGQFPNLPSYESLCVPDVFIPGSVENFAKIFWPDANPDFCNLVHSCSKPLVKVDEIAKRMILESLELQTYVDELFGSTDYVFRLTRYKAIQGENLGLAGHTDGNYLTIVSQNGINGVQILNKNEEWIDVNISENSCIVIVGDALMAYTNGRLRSPYHRVAMVGNKDRFSLQLFSAPNVFYKIEAPKELVDDEHPLLFKPYDLLGYAQYIAIRANQGVPNVLKSFCGV
ncbi:PREDICTED: probable 2-oxoglutarate-dependent dioxygenase AOP1.2 [Nicotiana attenuata]|uniref:2-oxoglutarate-dependent dioxygenase aop1.2 n=1 Tax=Nicotiana attenuata TaxID=49451 RepID=A0A1J6ITW9_NICAT|nr:PREDICTED: probable 2-oxoglutarate-dependent dioxygenase AOP1.2 [Nicotiana attenuata]OIT02235.1 putative 2-oxoglutarate-dependent dioxygenase aop1.2 [Nicotiana attenuata]